MKKTNFDNFVEKYRSVATTEGKHILLKDFMLSMSFEELLDWNNFLSDNIDVLIQKNINEGLTQEDKEFYRQQFARFDNLSEQMRQKAVA
jgi:hypothetical protein